jgi:hypothetical protein
MPRLRELRVTESQLTGPFPQWMLKGQLRVLFLSGNEFSYTEGDDLTKLVGSCNEGDVDCEGLPPVSCDAFGERYKPKTDNPLECVFCVSIIAPIAVAVSGSRALVAILPTSFLLDGSMRIHALIMPLLCSLLHLHWLARHLTSLAGLVLLPRPLPPRRLHLVHY